MCACLVSLTACSGAGPGADVPAIALDFVLPEAVPEDAAPEGPAVYRMTLKGDVETWVTDDGRAVTFNRKRRQLVRSEAPADPVKATRRWRNWDPLLLCLGPPLADPPGDDPDAFRKLAWDDEPLWVLQFSGMNRCNASGAVTLQAAGTRVDISKLVIDGIPWQRGGLERATELGMGYVQLNAVEWWLTGDDDARQILLRALRDDPDPASLAALQRILEVAGPAERRLVLSAIEHRPRQGPVAPDGTKPR